MQIEFNAPLWEWNGDKASWSFVSLTPEAAAEVRFALGGMPRRGFGSVKVEVTIGPQTWLTSLFPDKASGSFLLPVKKAVRTACKLSTGDSAHVRIRLVDL